MLNYLNNELCAINRLQYAVKLSLLHEWRRMLN